LLELQARFFRLGLPAVSAFRQLARAERVNELNGFLLADAQTSTAPLSVSELLQRAEQVVEREDYSKDPANHIQLLLSLADEYSNIGNIAKQRQFAEEAYRLSRGLSDASIRGRSACALGDALVDQAGKDNARAEALARSKGCANCRKRPNLYSIASSAF